MRARRFPLEFSGERLRRLRSAAGLSQADLADRASVARGSVQRWEQVDPRTGHSPRPPRFEHGLRVLLALRSALGRVVRPEELCVVVRTTRVPA